MTGLLSLLKTFKPLGHFEGKKEITFGTPLQNKMGHQSLKQVIK